MTRLRPPLSVTAHPGRRTLVALLTTLTVLLLAAPGCSRPIEPDGARLMARVKHQLDAGPRIPGTPGHAAIGEWIAAEITRLGGRLERQTFVDSTLGRPLPILNLIGHFGPAGGKRLVLAAHWDSREFADRDPDPARRGEPVPGANDGGSGVAVLLEVAEMMRKTPPAIAVDLVFFDGEDQGAGDSESYCLGARGYAARVRREEILAAFIFDMVGDCDLGIHPEVFSSQRASNLAALVVEGARATGARSFHAEPMFEVYDDHRPLLEAGIPAVDIIDFEYDAWHTTSDDLNHVSAASLTEVTRVAAWLVYRSPLVVRR